MDKLSIEDVNDSATEAYYDAKEAEKPYAVNYWGSHPDAGNDDCNSGFDYATREEAEAAYANDDPRYENGRPVTDWVYVEIDGPDVNKCRKNPNYDEARARREAEAEERAWRREMAMEAGMAFGCDGYNDMMGY